MYAYVPVIHYYIMCVRFLLYLYHRAQLRMYTVLAKGINNTDTQNHTINLGNV